MFQKSQSQIIPKNRIPLSANKFQQCPHLRTRGIGADNQIFFA